MHYIIIIGSSEQFGEVYTEGAIREQSSTSGVTAADPDDTGPPATEETVGEAVHPTTAGTPIHTGSAQATGRQNGNPFGSIRGFHPRLQYS